MTARKRKPNPKYNDDSPVKKAKIEDKTPTKRTAAPRAAKVNRSDPEWLVTNEKSPLAYENLHVSLIQMFIAFCFLEINGNYNVPCI